jgi:hypothetical protein
MLHVVALSTVNDGRAVTISDVINKVYKKCEQFNVIISEICSDSASNLKAVITKDVLEHLPFLLGHAVLRAACSAHKAQLAISDIVEEEEVATFASAVTELVAWIGKRERDFAQNCPCKVTKTIIAR